MPEKVVCSTMLREGQELSISMATHPLSRRLINAFLRTPEMSSTRRESRRRLYGGLRGQSSDYFFTGGIDKKMVGTLWYCTPAKCRELAYLGEVFTNRRYRNKGVATGLLETAIDHFGKEGGRAVYVTNLCPHAPRRVYQRLGFQAYGFGQQAYGGIIRLLVRERSEDFDRDYYEYDSNVCIRSVDRGDLPHFIALLNYPHEWIVRAYSLGLIGPVVFDELGRSFTDLIETLKTTDICLVLENSKKRMVGTACSSSLPAKSQSHVRTVDFLVHPNYYTEAPSLLKRLTEELGDLEVEKLQAYAATADKTKVEILRRCGFDVEATMPDQLRIGGKKSDLEVYCANIQLQS